MDEFHELLGCGNLTEGFLRLKCVTCKDEHLLAFSCKGRGFCPSCGARRREDATAHLTEHVLPDVALRQWVLTPPFELRGLLAARSFVLSTLCRYFISEIRRFIFDQAEQNGHASPKFGAIACIQRFSQTLVICPHLHCLVPDGYFVCEDNGTAVFYRTQPPDRLSALEIAKNVFQRITRYLKRKGFMDPHLTLSESDTWFIQAASEPSGIKGNNSLLLTEGHGKPRGDIGGFSVDASVVIKKGDRAGRIRLCRYVLRPPFAEKQLSITDLGSVRLALPKPRKGQTHIELSPVVFLRRLAWLVPQPMRNQIKFFGVFSSRAKERFAIVPAPPEPDEAVHEAKASKSTITYRHKWADLLSRVYDIDAEHCQKCGGRLRLVSAITDIDLVDHILNYKPKGGQDPPS